MVIELAIDDWRLSVFKNWTGKRKSAIGSWQSPRLLMQFDDPRTVP